MLTRFPLTLLDQQPPWNLILSPIPTIERKRYHPTHGQWVPKIIWPTDGLASKRSPGKINLLPGTVPSRNWLYLSLDQLLGYMHPPATPFTVTSNKSRNDSEP
jgi:hypothetical protein